MEPWLGALRDGHLLPVMMEVHHVINAWSVPLVILALCLVTLGITLRFESDRYHQQEWVAIKSERWITPFLFHFG